MAPPAGSIFDPAIKWEEEKERRRIEAAKETEEEAAAAAASKAKKGKGGGKKGQEKKMTTAESIKASNAAEKSKKDYARDLEKLKNLRTLKALQETTCDTASGKIQRMLKMLDLAVRDLKQGTVGSTEAEVLDILWAFSR